MFFLPSSVSGVHVVCLQGYKWASGACDELTLTISCQNLTKGFSLALLTGKRNDCFLIKMMFGLTFIPFLPFWIVASFIFSQRGGRVGAFGSCQAKEAMLRKDFFSKWWGLAVSPWLGPPRSHRGSEILWSAPCRTHNLTVIYLNLSCQNRM